MFMLNLTLVEETLLQHFDLSLKKPAILLQCPDKFSKMCDCGMNERTELKPVDPLQRQEITPGKK